MIWKVQIIILPTKTLRAIKVRHMNQVLKVDFILVHCGGSHYISLGNTFLILQLYTTYTLIIHHLYTFIHAILCAIQLYYLYHIDRNVS